MGAGVGVGTGEEPAEAEVGETLTDATCSWATPTAEAGGTRGAWAADITVPGAIATGALVGVGVLDMVGL
ncbi:MAG: hypothetical protein ACREKE_05390 [bacterium]